MYLDDILVTGATDANHLASLEEVLKRTELRVKKNKCKFMASSVSYLGHVIDASGLHPMPDKIKAVEDTPTPTNVTELKSYLGLLTYYGEFLPNLATRLVPLFKLLGKKTTWKWRAEQDKAFSRIQTTAYIITTTCPF